MWCNGGAWSLLIDECPDDPIVILTDAENLETQQTIILESGDDEAAYKWKLTALTIGVSILVGLCVYYVVRFVHKRAFTIPFFLR